MAFKYNKRTFLSHQCEILGKIGTQYVVVENKRGRDPLIQILTEFRIQYPDGSVQYFDPLPDEVESREQKKVRIAFYSRAGVDRCLELPIEMI